MSCIICLIKISIGKFMPKHLQTTNLFYIGGTCTIYQHIDVNDKNAAS